MSTAKARLADDPADRLDGGELFQLHPVATLVIDDAGRVVDANQAAEALFVRARANMLGHAIADIVHANPSDGLTRLLRASGKSAWAYSLELSSGTDILCVADLAVGPVGAGERWRMLAITPTPKGGRIPFRRPGSAARSASAAAAMLAHEVKNPLSGIRGAAQLLGKGAGNETTALSRLICGEVDRIAKLIDGMQGFTRHDALPRSSINIYPAIGQARGIAVQGFGSATRFIEEFDPSLPRVQGNHDALVQILLNLIKNAVEAASQEELPTVRLSTGYRHGLSWDADDGSGPQPLPVEIIVADNGPGVADHLKDALFDPFVTNKREGQGLGLALVDKLVRDMGGIIQYDRVREWTRFRLHLPVADGAGGPA